MTKKQIHAEFLRRLPEGVWCRRDEVVALINEVTRPGAKPYRFPWEPRTKATKRKARR